MIKLQTVLRFFAIYCFIQYSNADEPCNTKNLIDDHRRSVAYTSEGFNRICDNLLSTDWYRITSGSGERMPTECVDVSNYDRCNTADPIWLSNDSVPAGDDLFPPEGVTVDRIAYSSNLYECKVQKFDISIKGCQGYLVYHLVPTRNCPSAYCFGDQLPCPEGKSSKTGFTPGCGTFPNFERKPFVTSELKELPGILFGTEYIFSNITFICHVDDLDDLYQYNVRWYIADVELESAQQQNLTKADVENGLAVLHQEHWTSLFRPNFLVKCSLRAHGNGFDAPGPETVSEPFFAGIKTNQTQYTVSETMSISIPVWMTIPLPCGWNAKANETEKQREKDRCHLQLLNGIPSYQEDSSLCENGISDEGLVFDNQNCGISFTHSTINETSYLNITGAADNLMNLKDRIVFLRLYNNPSRNLPNIYFLYMFTGITIPDIKVTIQDKDVVTRGKACRSVNDPHMYTFDNPNENWELQYNTFGEGEFVMYRHERLPLQINAYFRRCNNNALCNCGIAVRSGDSLFVANFCETTYRSERRVNRYIVEQLCDEGSLIVTETGNKIEIIIPTGTKVEFTHGKVYNFYGINTISIYPSTLDLNKTRGLCGIFNENPNDDFTPREEFAPASKEVFARSWKITEENKADLTLFDPTGKLPATSYYGQEYCTCKVTSNPTPEEISYYNCNLTSAMKTCRSAKTTTSVIRASCSTSAYAGISKRSTENNDEEDQFPKFPLSTDNPESRNLTAEWRNGWTEELARDFCTQGIRNAPSFGPCMEHIPYLNATSYITTCILDIKLQGGTEWIQATLTSFTGACLTEAKKSENLTSSTTTSGDGKTMTIFESIEVASCPNNCSGNGICVQGECDCSEGFFGYDCALDKSTPPDIVREAFDGECDTTKRPCRKFTIPGYNFIKGSLVCNFTSFSFVDNGTETVFVHTDTFSYPGIYKSSFMMYCELPPSRRRRSINQGSTATVYNITVSNNGQDFTEEVTIMVFDSTCYSCNMSSLSCERLDFCKTQPNADNKDDTILIMFVLAAVATVVLSSVVGLISIRDKLCCRKKNARVSDSSISLNQNKNFRRG